MKNKILAVIVTLGGFASLAALPVVSSSQAATKTAPELLCPAGTSVISYCADYCPSGTLVAQYCESTGTTTTTSTTTTTTTVTSASGTTTVLAQGPPTLFGSILWGAKLKFSYEGPALKFNVKSGINGAPLLRTLTLTLPKGLTFSSKQKRTLAVNGPQLNLAKNSVTFNFRNDVASVLIYLKNHAMVESAALRKALAHGKVKSLTFAVSVTNASGIPTALSFSVRPQS